jgi:TolA-binding protein
MKFNVILPWLLALGLGAFAASVYVKSTAKDSEIQKLKQQNTELEPLRTEVEELRTRATLQEDQVTVSRKDKEELIKLRGEVGTLRDQAKRLSQDITAAQRQTAMAKAETAQATVPAASNAPATAAPAATTPPSTSDPCINNLRQIQGAKIKWSQETQKSAESTPTFADIAPYLNNTIPACPSNGVYTLNIVRLPPTCSQPGHQMTP